MDARPRRTGLVLAVLAVAAVVAYLPVFGQPLRGTRADASRGAGDDGYSLGRL
jgi:uncharacterized YccA/Bax inhibitor family protein